MKITIAMLLTFTLLPLQSGWANNKCRELRQDLLAIEYKLLNTPLDGCTGKCQNKLDIEKEYNKALAELIIAQGLFTVGQTMEGNHNELKRIDKERINKAQNYINGFNKALNKAELLDEAFTLANDKSVYFSDYTGSTKKDFERHMFTQCLNDSAPLSDKPLCQRMNRLKINDETRYHDYMDTLHGVLTADSQIDSSEFDKRAIQDKKINANKEQNKRFTEYKKKLEIRVDGKDYLSPSEFKKSEYYQKKYLEIEKALKNYNENDQASKEKVLALTQELDVMEVNFQGNSPSANPETNDVLAMLNKEISRNYDRLSVPNLIFTEPIQESFKVGQGQIESFLNRAKKTIDKNIAEGLKDITTKQINGRSIASQCSGNYDISCMKKICQNSKGEATTCSKHDKVGLSGLNKKVKEYEDLSADLSTLNKANACLKESSLEKKKECLNKYSAYQYEELADKSIINNLKAKVKGYETRLSLINGSSPFKELNIQKALVLDALNSNYCRKYKDVISCKDEQFDFVDSKVLNLGSIGEEVFIELNTKELRDAVNSKNPIKMKSMRSDFKASCLKSSQNIEAKNLCHLMQEEEEHKQRMREARFERSEYLNDRYLKVEKSRRNEPNYAGIFFESFGTTLLYEGIQKGVPAYVQYQSTKDDTKFMKDQIAAYDEWFLKRNEFLQDYIDNPPTSGFLYTNTGLPFLGSNVTDQLNFQSNQTGMIYNRFDTTSFNFSPIPTTTSLGQQAATTSTGTTSSAYTQTYGFGF